MNKLKTLVDKKHKTIQSAHSLPKYDSSKKNNKKKSMSQHQLKLNANLTDSSNVIRSKVFSVHVQKKHEAPPRINLYEKFVRELNIKLPSPKQKFLEFLNIAPFNRLKNHIQFIAHILKSNYEFFKKHPSQVIDHVARKIIKLDINKLPINHLIILDQGTCFYHQKRIEKGRLIARKNFDFNHFSFDHTVSLLGLHVHDYSQFVSQYLNNNMEMFKKFLKTIQLFKIFPETSMQKIYTGLNVHFFTKGEVLYSAGDDVNDLFLIYDGVVARKIIVEIDQTNKIPLQKYSKLVKVFSRFYEHKILFTKQDLVGVTQIIDNMTQRSEQIVIEEDSTILTIDRASIQQSLDEYIVDRFRKYNMKKYPKNYDELCQNYFKEKTENKKAEERKIAALRGEMQNNINQKRSDKINTIITLYKQRIKSQERQHLVRKKKFERIVQNQT